MDENLPGATAERANGGRRRDMREIAGTGQDRGVARKIIA
jgi:hypothetical protein